MHQDKESYAIKTGTLKCYLKGWKCRNPFLSDILDDLKSIKNCTTISSSLRSLFNSLSLSVSRCLYVSLTYCLFVSLSLCHSVTLSLSLSVYMSLSKSFSTSFFISPSLSISLFLFSINLSLSHFNTIFYFPTQNTIHHNFHIINVHKNLKHFLFV